MSCGQATEKPLPRPPLAPTLQAGPRPGPSPAPRLQSCQLGGAPRSSLLSHSKTTAKAPALRKWPTVLWDRRAGEQNSAKAARLPSPPASRPPPSLACCAPSGKFPGPWASPVSTSVSGPLFLSLSLCVCLSVFCFLRSSSHVGSAACLPSISGHPQPLRLGGVHPVSLALPGACLVMPRASDHRSLPCSSLTPSLDSPGGGQELPRSPEGRSELHC